MISVFCTGGTFDKIYFDANSEFSIGEPQAQPLLKEANLSIDYDVQSLLKKDSLDMDDNDRAVVVNTVKHCNNQHIIITHGTDSMVATAKAIATAEIEAKTIVLVGAMQPARMRYSDAAFNLGFAIASVQLAPTGIFIAMNGQLFDYDNVAKNLRDKRFESI